MRKTIVVMLFWGLLIAIFCVSCEKEEPDIILPDMGTHKNYRDTIPVPRLPIIS